MRLLHLASLAAVDALVASRRPLRRLRANLATTTPIDVYIESTDCQQVVFYSNYFKFLEYGLGERLVAADGVKYARAAVLGDALTVETEPRSDGGGFAQRIARGGETLISAEVTNGGDTVVVAAPAAPPPAASRLTARHSVRHDDRDGRDGGVSLDACLRYFERSRSSFLGGPSALGALQDAGVAVVVSSVDALRFAPATGADAATADAAADVSLRGSRVIFEQYVTVGGGGAVASATISCAFLDTARGRPCRPPPAITSLFDKGAP